MRYRNLLKIVMPVLLLMGSAAPSWAGGGGFALGLGLGALFTADVIANSYPPYYAYPYYQTPYYPGSDYYAPAYDYPRPLPYAEPRPIDRSAYGQTPAVDSAAQDISPDRSPHDLTVVNDYHLELRTLLDEKLKDGAITRAQHDAAANGVDQLDRQAHAEAAAHGGTLTGDEQSALIQQYQRDYYLFNHDFIVD